VFCFFSNALTPLPSKILRGRLGWLTPTSPPGPNADNQPLCVQSGRETFTSGKCGVLFPDPPVPLSKPLNWEAFWSMAKFHPNANSLNLGACTGGNKQVPPPPSFHSVISSHSPRPSSLRRDSPTRCQNQFQTPVNLSMNPPISPRRTSHRSRPFGEKSMVVTLLFPPSGHVAPSSTLFPHISKERYVLIHIKTTIYYH